MEWILRSPQIHSTFGSLGYGHGDGYHVNENCNEALANILHNLLNEDKYLRTYRRNISFGQNIQKDIIPLLIHAKEGKTIELLISILVNLTIPVECLLSVNVIDKTVFGRHAIFEITNLLTSTKEAFTDHRVTKVVVEFLKKNLDFEKPVSLTPEQCTNTGNGLLLLRNILHIPELETAAGTHTKQNQILWNIFSQSIDKVLIKLMTIPEANNWSVPMVQLVALMYKDQHAATQHKLLNFWLEASQSESSEDNESNTSPPDRGDSEDSSLMLTSDPTSDSSNTSEEITGWGQGNTDDAQPANSTQSPQAPGPTSAQLPAQPPPSQNPPPPVAQPPPAKPPPAQPPPTQPPPAQPPPALPPPPPPPLNPQADHAKSAPKSPKAPGNPVTESIATKRQLNYSASLSSGVDNGQSGSSSPKQFVSSDSQKKESMTSETSGYGTQLEQETISTSSNEDEPPKPLKPHHPKHKANTKTRIGGTASERKRKKIVKRSKGTIINVQGLSWKIPTDEDIAHVLKEFTVDFLLKGYNALVQTLHNQILTDPTLEIDTSHFFWLVTYFLKFATQIELSLENVSSVLSFDIAAYLAAEGVHLCEEFELVKKIHGGDLKPYIRRMHLVVTAIREFVLAIEVYQKQSLYTDENKDAFQQLQIKLCEMEELRLLMVLLLKHYNPIYHNKQYLQDLIITNHFLLIFVDNILRQPHYKGKTNMVDQVKQFATPEMMYQYALLLEDYKENGEFVNDCIFTLMHHVGGELESLIALYQPKILKIFTAIWKTEFEICDDWSDLIEYVINTFIKRPNSLLSARSVCLDAESFEDESFVPPAPADQPRNYVERKKPDSHYDSSEDMWTDTELSSLSWNFMQCNMDKDVIGEIVKLFKEDGVVKSRESVIKELHKQNLISQAEADSMLKTENDTNSKTHQQTKDSRINDISKLCELLIQDGKSKFLEWMQKVLLDTCFAKIYLEKKAAESPCSQLKFECFKKKHVDLPQISPVAYHCLLKNMSVPLVPWNFDQATICKDLKFLRLVHKLGFHMPVDTGKLFIRIPHSWTADILYDVAGKIMPIDTSKLKFSKNDISVGTALTQTQTNTFTLSADVMKEDVTLTSSSEIYYRIHKQDHHATMVNFTPMPGISFEEGVTGSTEALKRNWLEVVQRSQELKITLQVKNEVKIKSSGRVLGGDARIFVPPLPSLCALTVTAHPHPQRSLPLPGFVARDDDETMMEDEDNSLCETASVASDLTRMYVSDEDEKLDLLLPNMEVEPGLLAIDDATSDSDS